MSFGRFALGAFAACWAGGLAGCGDGSSPATGVGGAGGTLEPIVLERTLAELLREPARITTKSPGAGWIAPRIGTLSPVGGGRAQGRPSVVVPPGGRVQVDLPRLSEPAKLRLSVTPNRQAYNTGAQPSEWGIRVLLDGEPVAGKRFDVHKGIPDDDRAWHDIVLDVLDQETLTVVTQASGSGKTNGLIGISNLELFVPESVPRAARSSGKPDVLLVVIDTLRADRLSAYGYERATSPNLEALANRGTAYDFAIAPAPWTWPSTASILTGTDPPQHGVLSVNSCYLPNLFETLPELFGREGFTTAGWSTNPLVQKSRNWDQGFETWADWAWDRAPDVVLPAVDAHLAAHPKERLFTYVHLTEPHMPYVPDDWATDQLGLGAPPKGWDADIFRRATQDTVPTNPEPKALFDRYTPYASDAYDAEVLCADKAVGDLLALLEREGRLENTIVAVTSDHGEEFREHGLTGHSHNVYRESVHVPLILAGPGVETAQRREGMVAMHRIFSTLLELTNIDPPKVAGLQPSLLDGEADEFTHSSTDAGWWIGESTSRRLMARRTKEDLLLWALNDPEKHVVGGKPDAFRSNSAYFDLGSDPAAQAPGLAETPRSAEMQQALADWWMDRESKSLGALSGGAEVEDLLRAAGYIK